MSKRQEPVELLAAREALRERLDAQLAAAAGFFAAADRAARLRGELAALEQEQAVHAAALAAATAVVTAARLVGWSGGQVRAAVQLERSRRAPRAGTADTTAAERSAS